MAGKEEWKQIRDFFRDYVDKSFNNQQSTVRWSRANSHEHNKRVAEICLALFEADIPFYTEVKLKCGLRPDIVTPTHVVKCIEVFHTEDMPKFVNKKVAKIPSAFKDEFLFINTNKPFFKEDVL